MSDLILVENLTAVELFSKDGIDPLLVKIKEEVRKFKGDMTTVAGRKEIASRAYQISRTKTYLDDQGKRLTEDMKARCKVIDNERKKVREELDALRDEVRKPLDEFEAKEEARLQCHRDAIQRIKDFQNINFQNSSECQQIIKEIESMQIGANFEEFLSNAMEAREASLNVLNSRFMALEASEKQAAELLALKIEKQKRDQEEHERILKEQAAEQARKEAESKAKIELQKLQQENLKAQMEKEQLELKAKKAQEDAAKAEQKRLDDVARLEKEKKEAQGKAIEAEKERAKLEQEAKDKENAKREANKKHQKRINNETLASLLVFGLPEDQAKLLIVSIAKNEIKNLKIVY